MIIYDLIRGVACYRRIMNSNTVRAGKHRERDISALNYLKIFHCHCDRWRNSAQDYVIANHD